MLISSQLALRWVTTGERPIGNRPFAWVEASVRFHMRRIGLGRRRDGTSVRLVTQEMQPS